jgi:hypothetical protein
VTPEDRSYRRRRRKSRTPTIARHTAIAINGMDNAAIASTPNKMKSFNSMFDISEQAAGVIYYTAGVAAIIGTLITLVGGGLVLWADGVRDKYAAIQQSDNEAKIATANSAAAQANEGLAKAHLDIEERKRENLDLKLQLENAHALAEEARQDAFNERWEREMEERDTLPRKLNSAHEEQHGRAIVKFAGTKFAIVTLPDTECRRTGKMLEKYLRMCRWVRAEPTQSFDESDEFDFGEGITIESGSGSLSQSPLYPAIMAIDWILADSLISARPCFRTRDKPNSLPDDVIRIVVGTATNRYKDSKRFIMETRQRRMEWESAEFARRRAAIDAWRSNGKLPDETILKRLPPKAWKTIAETNAPSGLVVVCGGPAGARLLFEPVADALEAAGWEVVCEEMELRGDDKKRKKIEGVIVATTTTADKQVKSAAQKLCDTLSKAGFEPTLTVHESIPGNAPSAVIIGLREFTSPPLEQGGVELEK